MLKNELGFHSARRDMFIATNVKNHPAQFGRAELNLSFQSVRRDMFIATERNDYLRRSSDVRKSS